MESITSIYPIYLDIMEKYSTLYGIWPTHSFGPRYVIFLWAKTVRVTDMAQGISFTTG